MITSRRSLLPLLLAFTAGCAAPDGEDESIAEGSLTSPKPAPHVEYTEIESGVVPTSACADSKVNVQVSYDVAARQPIKTLGTTFDKQVVLEQGLAKGSPEWKSACTTKGPDIAR